MFSHHFRHWVFREQWLFLMVSSIVPRLGFQFESHRWVCTTSKDPFTPCFVYWSHFLLWLFHALRTQDQSCLKEKCFEVYPPCKSMLGPDAEVWFGPRICIWKSDPWFRSRLKPLWWLRGLLLPPGLISYHPLLMKCFSFHPFLLPSPQRCVLTISPVFHAQTACTLRVRATTLSLAP